MECQSICAEELPGEMQVLYVAATACRISSADTLSDGCFHAAFRRKESGVAILWSWSLWSGRNRMAVDWNMDIWFSFVFDVVAHQAYSI